MYAVPGTEDPAEGELWYVPKRNVTVCGRAEWVAVHTADKWASAVCHCSTTISNAATNAAAPDWVVAMAAPLPLLGGGFVMNVYEY